MTCAAAVNDQAAPLVGSLHRTYGYSANGGVYSQTKCPLSGGKADMP